MKGRELIVNRKSERCPERQVAVVEDDRSVRNGLRRLLDSTGRGVITYASAEEFISRLPLDKPSCLLLDIHLGGMSGVELLEKLVRDNVRIPVVFITATDESPAVAGFEQQGAVACLRKPFDETTLIQAIDSAIDKVSKLG